MPQQKGCKQRHNPKKIGKESRLLRSTCVRRAVEGKFVYLVLDEEDDDNGKEHKKVNINTCYNT
jgi:hypothetical protein